MGHYTAKGGREIMLLEPFHVAVPTAFHQDESLNVEDTLRHIISLYEQGVNSVLVCGTTGEQHSLTFQEKEQLMHAINMETELTQKMEIIFGISSTRQQEAEALATMVHTTSIAGIMIGYPPYIQPSQREAIGYTKAITLLADKPAILYNNPPRTGFDLSTESVHELFHAHQNIIGLKEAGAKDRHTIQSLKASSPELLLYAGGEQKLATKVEMGFDRLSSIAGNLAPTEVLHWFQTLQRSNFDRLGQEWLPESITKVLENVYNEGAAIQNLKEELNRKGQVMGSCRRPIGN